MLMLVVPRAGGPGVVRYRAWLGESLGFTEEFIATTHVPSSLPTNHKSVRAWMPATNVQNLVD